jgi:N-methylhydantoinase B/oxoprolinase/acetone carboxylase alpha subunit
MAINYTQDMVDLMTVRYSANPTRETVEELAAELNKSIKSVIGKLSREGIYQKTEYLTKTGEKPITKKELVTRIGEVLGIEYQALAGLEKSPKQALKSLTESLVLNLKPEEWESL